METNWDVVVVGGGSAGLSAALILGRARRRVLVVDAGLPRNRFAGHMHGVLGHDGKPPLQLVAEGRREVESYGGVVVAGVVTGAERTDAGFEVSVDDGSVVTARRLVVATGLKDDLPPIPGVAEQWGRGVVACPYCDGWEHRDSRIAVLATSPMSLHQVQLLRQWSAEVTYLLNDVEPPSPEEQRILRARGITVVEGAVSAVLGGDGPLTGVELADGGRVDLDVIFTFPRPRPLDGVLRQLGAEVAETPFGLFPVADPFGQTSVPGVWIAGNVGSLQANVPVAISGGMIAGVAANADLVTEDTELALTAYDQAHGTHGHGPHEHGHDHDHGHANPGSPWGSEHTEAEPFWEDLHGSRDHIGSGNPNVVLVHEVAALTPGRALDLGCADGADAVFLAERGWTVTGVDVSPTALARADRRATDAGVSGSVTWQQHDLAQSFPEGRYDLVSAQFLHSPIDFPRDAVLRRAADAVAPGGRLLIVGHLGVPKWAPADQPPVVLPTAQEVLDTLRLEPGEWRVDRVEAVARDAVGPDGQTAILDDAVLAATRLAG